MTEKQIEKIRLSIKKHRAALSAENRKFGGFDDGAGRRYYISDLYLRIGDYKGAITYKKWFDKNFPDDIGGALLSLNWSIAYFELGKLTEAEIYAINTAFQNVYLHGLLLDREVEPIDMYDEGFDSLEFAKSMIKGCKKVLTKPYLDWLACFMDSDDYKEAVGEFVSLNKLLNNENIREKRIALFQQLRDLVHRNKNRRK